MQDTLYFAFQHRYIPGYHGIVIRSEEGGPGIESHPRVDRRAHLSQLEVVAADGVLVDAARELLSRLAGDPVERGFVEGALRDPSPPKAHGDRASRARA